MNTYTETFSYSYVRKTVNTQPVPNSIQLVAVTANNNMEVLEVKEVCNNMYEGTELGTKDKKYKNHSQPLSDVLGDLGTSIV